MKTKHVIALLLTLVLVPSSLAFGMGIINNMDFGVVQKGETYTKNIKFYPFDNYADDLTADVYISSTDPYVSHTTDLIVAPMRQYTTTPLTLTIPKNAKKGYYESYVCATGACATLKYIVKKVKKPKK